MVPAFRSHALRRLFNVLALALALAPSPGAAAPWLDDSGHPTAAAREAVAILRGADADGLDPDDYGVVDLRRRVDAAGVDALPPAGAAALERSLTSAMMSYLHDLHAGRIDPRSIHDGYAAPLPGVPDLRGALLAAARENDLREFVRAQAPRVPMYAMLRAALARYRSLAADRAWTRRLPPLPRRAVRVGDRWDGLPLVAARLRALGDLPAPGGAGDGGQAGASPGPSDDVAGDALDERLSRALATFQDRHGLAPDGVLGRATYAQLEVPPALRAHAIALAMERLRWTPLTSARREIVVNVPEFRLRAYEMQGDRAIVKLSMNVIVGKAVRTRTPLFRADMRFIEFSPYWNVPWSIASKETVPRLRRDPAYWDEEGFEFVSRSGQVLGGLDGARLDAVLRGDLRIRQRPGPRNALGDIKFIFPNDASIFLHHTPATALFQRERRDFSHGCIRVEDPVGLARFVLEGAPEWTEQRIREAMTQGRSETIRVPEPIPVVIAYSTVVVDHGRVRFLPDLYGNDRLLDEALERRSESRRRSGIPAQSPPVSKGEGIAG